MAKRLALITGGTSGIGFGTAKALATSYDLALVYASDDAKADAAKKHLASEYDTDARVYKQTLTCYDDCKSLIDQIAGDCGRQPLVLVNSAGRIRDGLYLSTEFAPHATMIQEHLLVTMALSHLLMKPMYRERWGRIVNLSSISARFAKRGQASYAAAKSGIEGFTRTLALEVAHRGITVNAIAPGLIETNMTKDFLGKLNQQTGDDLSKKIPAGYAGQPQDVGAMIAYLASDAARYITGTVITIDGGRSLGDPLS